MIFLLCCRQRKINRGSWLLGKGCASARAGCAWHQLRHVPESTVSGRQMYTQKTFQHTHAPVRHGGTRARSAGPLPPLLASSASCLSSPRTPRASVSASVPRVASEFAFCPGRSLSLPLTASPVSSLWPSTLSGVSVFLGLFLPCFVCTAPCLPTRSLSVTDSLWIFVLLSVSLTLSPPLSPSVSVSVWFSLSLICLSVWLRVHLSLYLSVSLCLLISLSPYLFVCLFLSVSICLSISDSLCVSICLLISLSLSDSVSLCLCPLSLSVFISVCLSVSLSVSSVSISLSLSLSESLSVSLTLPGSVLPHLSLSFFCDTLLEMHQRLKWPDFKWQTALHTGSTPLPTRLPSSPASPVTKTSLLCGAQGVWVEGPGGPRLWLLWATSPLALSSVRWARAEWQGEALVHKRGAEAPELPF